jgi:Holliday junction resolvase
MGASQRNKGASGEREWCRMLEIVGVNAKRALGQARDGGGDVPAPPYCWEVKRRARISIYEHLDQVVAAAPQYEGCSVPALALRADNREWLVVLRATDVLPLLYAKAALL